MDSKEETIVNSVKMCVGTAVPAMAYGAEACIFDNHAKEKSVSSSDYAGTK